MSKLSNSSAIRRCFDDDLSGNDSDESQNTGDIKTDIEDVPSDVSHVSSGSGDDYNPALDTNNYSDSDNENPATTTSNVTLPRHKPTQPPTNDSDSDNEPGPTPPQSPADIIWNLLVKETNDYANANLRKKEILVH
ncbi:hypothetical protein J6590_069627 [Homalodisca vitripennis]|nr:hypothetical protein J6590_069627 [Homalodisca vitripennis]